MADKTSQGAVPKKGQGKTQKSSSPESSEEVPSTRKVVPTFHVQPPMFQLMGDGFKKVKGKAGLHVWTSDMKSESSSSESELFMQELQESTQIRQQLPVQIIKKEPMTLKDLTKKMRNRLLADKKCWAKDPLGVDLPHSSSVKIEKAPEKPTEKEKKAKKPVDKNIRVNSPELTGLSTEMSLLNLSDEDLESSGSE